jgi:Amino acid synthesis
MSNGTDIPMKAEIRKMVVQVDETRREMGQAIDPPTRRAVAMAVIANPFAGRYEANLDPLMDIGEELGKLLGEQCVAALGIAPGEAESYGKAAIVGEAGELEHAAAILHPKLGAPLRAAVDKGAGSGLPLMCRWVTRTRRSCAAISMRSRHAWPMHREPMKLS